jgi:hypothetical protein
MTHENIVWNPLEVIDWLFYNSLLSLMFHLVPLVYIWYIMKDSNPGTINRELDFTFLPDIVLR